MTGAPSTSSAKRPAITASGTLAKTPLVHLLLYALEKKLSGTIELITPDRRTASVFFVAGQPAKTRAGEPVAYLGQVLLELGSITEDQLLRSLADLAKAKAAGRALHGELLQAQGLISGSKLETALREQLARKLRHAASFPPETVYAYYEGFDGLRGWGADTSPAFDPMPMLWPMLHQSAPWSHVSAVLARVIGAPLKLSTTAEIARLGLGEVHRAAAEVLRERPSTAAAIAAGSGLAEKDAQLLAYLLLVTKQVDVMRPGGAVPTNSPPPVTASQPPARTSIPSAAPGQLKLRPSMPPHLSPELVVRWKEVLDRAAKIDRADYFMMLDLARDATHDDVESAFFVLAKKWHPDRLPPELAPVRDACSRVFARMSEAHTTLADDEHRAQYMSLLADGSGSPEAQETVAKVVEAATDFQKAEVCFKRNDLVQAEAMCRKAVAADPTQPDYHALLAWLVALKPEGQSPDKTLECIRMLDRAIAMSDRCEKAYFWRGMLYRRSGKNDAALRDFKRAADLNPRNIDAVREVRLHQMRGNRSSTGPPPAARRYSSSKPAKPDDTAKSGLFGRLFKKP